MLPTLLLFKQPFGINALVGLIALPGILMRNTLILIEQILALIPLTQSVFWGTLAFTLIGGTLAGRVLTLMFLPAMYSIWLKIKPVAGHG